MLDQNVNPEALKEEAGRRLVARRMAELRQIHDSARASIRELEQPIGPSPAAMAAKQKADDAARDLEKAKRMAERAAAKLAAVEAEAPKGWKRLLDWLAGRLRVFEKRRAKAAEASENAEQMLRARRFIASGFRNAYEEEGKKDHARRAEEMAARRKPQEQARTTMERVSLAVEHLKRTPGAASLTTAGLLGLAETERQRRRAAALEKEVEAEAARCAAGPRPRTF